MKNLVSVCHSSNGCIIRNVNGYLLVDIEFLLQPIVSSSGSVLAFEALSRIHAKNDELLCNEDFFGSSEVDTIKYLTLEQMTFFKNFTSKQRKIISYNLPISSLLDNDFVTKLIAMNTIKFAIEITDFDIDSNDETSMITIRNSFRRLKRFGNQIWFDDYVNDNENHRKYFNLFSWDAVKLDKQYLLFQDNYEDLSNVIMKMRSKVKHTIVEGVESSYQLEFLKRKKVKLQGFHISHPINEYKAKLMIKERSKVSLYA